MEYKIFGKIDINLVFDFIHKMLNWKIGLEHASHFPFTLISLLDSFHNFEFDTLMQLW